MADEKQNLILQSFLFSLGVVIYVTLISWLLFNGESLFGKMTGFHGPLMLLMLFIISALITSLLVFGRPVYLYFENKKKEGINLLFLILGWLIIFTILGFTILGMRG